MLRTSYIIKRCGFALVTIFVSITLNFFLFRVMSGSAVSNLSHVPHGGPKLQHALTVEFGLDKSKLEQYWLYLKQLAHGNLGISFTYRQPVSHLLLGDLKNTAILVTAGTVIGIVLGTISGVVSAWRRGSVTDHVNSGVAISAYALPTQWIGLVLLILFARILPSAGMTNPFSLGAETIWQQLADVCQHMILPTLTLALTGYGSYMLIMRSSMLETMGEDYVLTARAKGLSQWRIVWRHAARNALLPMVTQVALDLGYIVGGAVLIEVLFSWPGIGEAVFTAIGQRDYPMLEGGFLMLTIAVILVNLVTDLIYCKLDPRVKL